MNTVSKGTTYTIDFSKEPTEIDSEWPDQETKNQTDQAVLKIMGQIKDYAARNSLLTAATYVCGQSESGATFRSCNGTTVVVYVFPEWDKKE
jgi:hypothetical protein